MYLPPLISKLFYALLLSSLPRNPAFSGPIKATFRKKISYRRTAAAVRFVDGLIPGVAVTDAWSRWIHKKNRFPWSPDKTELIASGSGTAVFKICLENGDKALRIYRKSLGKPLDGLLRIVAHYRSNYQTMLTWYGSSPGLVLPMDFLVLQAPGLVGPVAASLQPYIHGKKYDLFEDYSDHEFLGLLEKHAPVREQFLFFARQTLRQWHGQKMCFDFLGRENIMVVNQGGHYRLRISDYGIFWFDRLGKKYPRIMGQVEERIKRLVSLYELARDFQPRER